MKTKKTHMNNAREYSGELEGAHYLSSATHIKIPSRGQALWGNRVSCLSTFKMAGIWDALIQYRRAWV